MRWEELTAPRFAKAVKEVGGVCIIPLGVVEKHGEHLPLGTDYLYGSFLADAAANVESAMVFPPYYLSQIQEAKHQPGTIAIGYQLMFDLLDNICAEIARNGLKKIIILNCHGGNNSFLRHFSMYSLERQRDYVVYILELGRRSPMNEPEWKKMQETSVDGHAGEMETSAMLAAFPDLCHMDQIGGDGMPRQRLDHLKGLVTGMFWYADFPDHYDGDAAYATVAKGKYLLNFAIKKTAEFIKIVKKDTATAPLYREFFRAQDPIGNYNKWLGSGKSGKRASIRRTKA